MKRRKKKGITTKSVRWDRVNLKRNQFEDRDRSLPMDVRTLSKKSLTMSNSRFKNWRLPRGEEGMEKSAEES